MNELLKRAAELRLEAEALEAQLPPRPKHSPSTTTSTTSPTHNTATATDAAAWDTLPGSCWEASMVRFPCLPHSSHSSVRAPSIPHHRNALCA